MRVFFLFILSTSAFCQSFSLQITRPYDRAWYKVTETKGKFICVTESYPYFEARENPLKNVDWKILEAEGRSKPPCKMSVAIIDERDPTPRQSLTCLTQPHTQALVERLTTLCKSEL